MRPILFAGLALLAASNPAWAGTVTIALSGMKTTEGKISVLLCDREHFLKPTCPLASVVSIDKPNTTVVFKDVPEGRYSAVAHHDLNGNGRMDLMLGMPNEPFAISGPGELIPSFDKSSFAVGPGATSISIKLK